MDSIVSRKLLILIKIKRSKDPKTSKSPETKSIKPQRANPRHQTPKNQIPQKPKNTKIKITWYFIDFSTKNESFLVINLFVSQQANYILDELRLKLNKMFHCVRFET